MTRTCQCDKPMVMTETQETPNGQLITVKVCMKCGHETS
jgi:hypothetical protein